MKKKIVIGLMALILLTGFVSISKTKSILVADEKEPIVESIHYSA